MSSILGDYERPRRPFPIFSLSREDVHWTILLSIVSFYVAIVIRASQAEHIVEVKSAWKGCLVVFGTILGILFAIISIAKMCCGYGSYFSLFSDEAKPEYHNLEDARQAEVVIQTSTNESSHAIENRAVKKTSQTDVTVVSSQQAVRTQTLTSAETIKHSRFEESRVVRSDERVKIVVHDLIMLCLTWVSAQEGGRAVTAQSAAAATSAEPRSARSDASRSSRSLSVLSSFPVCSLCLSLLCFLTHPPSIDPQSRYFPSKASPPSPLAQLIDSPPCPS